MATLKYPPTGDCQLLHISGVDWKSYVRMRRIFADRTGIRMTYDR